MSLLQNKNEQHRINRKRIILSILSGLLLTGSFPSHGSSWVSWFSLVPLLIALSDLSYRNGFRIGLLTGLVHYLTLVYWLAHTMKTYGNLPIYISIPVLFLLSFYLALYVAFFSTVLIGFCKKSLTCLIMIPIFWVSFEYVRSFLFTGFPWGLIGYSQFNNLHLIQISDIFGVYGVSFLILLFNAALFQIYLYFSKTSWQGKRNEKSFALGSLIVSAILIGIVWLYGEWSLDKTDEMTKVAPTLEVAVIQGNIDQSIKWDTKFQRITTEKYVALSLGVKETKPDLIVWPETATPFYYLYNPLLTKRVQQCIVDTGSDFLIGSPSFVRKKNSIDYHNSAYLIKANGNIQGKYDKTHLVPFGEYVPFRQWLPFIGKMVEHVGDFKAGTKGKTIQWDKDRLGIQICYEIIFPNLSRKMVKNDATFLINITNDAWYGRTSAPFQHFSMSVFRAVENRRSLIRSANTGISGFIHPSGKIVAKTDLFKEAVVTASIPRFQKKSLYTRFGDVFAGICLAITILLMLKGLYIKQNLS